jgi:hypothetical protein
VLTRIPTADLAIVIRRRIRAALDAGQDHLRDPNAFEAHLLAVAGRAEAVATELARRLPPGEAPDPVASFVAGAWHDAGKIVNGDDYHEITSALELLEHGVEWGLVAGSREEMIGALRRAALAVLPHFALYEQLHDGYAPSSGMRGHVPALLTRLVTALDRSPGAGPAFLPNTIDALVLVYSDMSAEESINPPEEVDEWFDRRWNRIERAALIDDPAIVPILPRVRPRIRAGCHAVQRLLTGPDDHASSFTGGSGVGQ